MLGQQDFLEIWNREAFERADACRSERDLQPNLLAVDFVTEGMRRLVVNAAYHLLGLDVPEKADVDYVDPFYPSFYGFIRDKEWFKGLDMQAEDYGLGKTPHAPDPKGTPDWPFRPIPKK